MYIRSQTCEYSTATVPMTNCLCVYWTEVIVFLLVNGMTNNFNRIQKILTKSIAYHLRFNWNYESIYIYICQHVFTCVYMQINGQIWETNAENYTHAFKSYQTNVFDHLVGKWLKWKEFKELLPYRVSKHWTNFFWRNA